MPLGISRSCRRNGGSAARSSRRVRSPQRGALSAPGTPPAFTRGRASPAQGCARLSVATREAGPQRHCRCRIVSPLRVSALPAPQELARRCCRVCLSPRLPVACAGAAPCSPGFHGTPTRQAGPEEAGEVRDNPGSPGAESDTAGQPTRPRPKPPARSAGPSRRWSPAKRCA